VPGKVCKRRILPSDVRGSAVDGPISVIEAMRAGTSVISSAGGALREVVATSDKNEIYEDPEDFDALTEILSSVIHAGVGSALGRRDAARSAYENLFNAQYFVDASIESYRKALSVKTGAKKLRVVI